MSNVLDVDLRSFDAAYDAWVNHAPEVVEAVEHWHLRAKGHAASLHDLHHAYWRVLIERDRWGTLRRALQDTWPGGEPSDSNGPPPVEPPKPPSINGPIAASLRGRVIQVSDEDGILNRGYSYWSQAWVGPDGVAYLFAGHRGGLARFYSVTLRDEPFIKRLGSLVPYVGEAEGWYFDREGWVYLTEGPRLHRVSPFTGEDRVVFDISAQHPGCRLWQSHSSEDGTVHSATVQRIVSDGPYPRLGTVVFRNGKQEWYPSAGALDESSVDASGEYLVIKEGEDNIIVTLERGDVRMIRDADGAIGHSDCGHGFMVGEDNIAGACVRVDLTTLERRTLYSTWNLGHLSVRGDRVLVSDAEAKSLRLVDLKGRPIGEPTAHGMVGEGYDYQCHANLSPCGRVAAFVSNRTGRFEMYLVTL